MTSASSDPTSRPTDRLGSSPLGAAALWHADAAHSVVTLVDLRHADHGCEFALHTSTVELDTRGPHTTLDLLVTLEAVVCARCGTPLREPAAQDMLRWSVPHCVMASPTHPNLLVAAGTLTIGSIGHAVELVGSATVHADILYLQITGALPHGTLTAGRAGERTFGDTSMSVTAQLRDHVARPDPA